MLEISFPGMSSMQDKYFLDTNILVYSFDKSQPVKQNISRTLIKEGLEQGSACISYQVIQEYLNVATRKFATPLSNKDCRIYLTSVLEPLCEIYASIELFHMGMEISDRWKISFYDSLIIAGSIQANCKILYSEDLQHDQKIQDIRIVNPYL
jgi:predicted nucleic acid-binding protein